MNFICICGHEDRRHENTSLYEWGDGECTLCKCKFFECKTCDKQYDKQYDIEIICIVCGKNELHTHIM